MIEALRTGLAQQASPERVADDLRALGLNADEPQLTTAAARLSAFISATPDRIRALIRITTHPQHGRAVAFGLAQVLVYALDENDLVSETSSAAVGLLDDAYLVHRFLADVCQAYPATRELAGSIDDFETRDLVGRMLPPGVATALDRTSERLVLVGASLFTVPATNASPPTDAPDHAFRLGELFDRHASSV
jgi:hypothetical protein